MAHHTGLYGLVVRTEEMYCILNAAEGQLDVLLATEESILTAQSWHAPTRGAEILTPVLQDLLRVHKLLPADIAKFACVHGPGSFTGIRLTMGTVAALRRVTQARNASIDYMQALALTAYHNVQEAGVVERPMVFAVLTHARRNLVHVQYFVQGAEESSFLPQAQGLASLASPEAVAERMAELATQGSLVYALGSGLARNKAIIQEHAAMQMGQAVGPEHVRCMSIVHPSPKALWQLALQASYTKEDLEPLYIRPCDAVENLDYIATKQGMEPREAHARLQALLEKKVDEEKP